MTAEQLLIAKQQLTVAFEARMLAAKTYRQALEFIVPLVGGDETLIREARDTEAKLAAFIDQTLASIKDGTAAGLTVTFGGHHRGSE